VGRVLLLVLLLPCVQEFGDESAHGGDLLFFQSQPSVSVILIHPAGVDSVRVVAFRFLRDRLEIREDWREGALVVAEGRFLQDWDHGETLDHGLEGFRETLEESAVQGCHAGGLWLRGLFREGCWF